MVHRQNVILGTSDRHSPHLVFRYLLIPQASESETKLLYIINPAIDIARRFMGFGWQNEHHAENNKTANNISLFMWIESVG